MRSKTKTLLGIELYEFTGKEIGDLRAQYKHDRYLESILPQYSINEQYGNILRSEYYHQFTNNGEKKFLLFDASTVDKLLGEEISNAGLENLLKGIDLRPYLSKFTKLKYKDFNRCLPNSEYLIVELTYTGGGFNMEYDDFDMEVNVVGALIGNNLELITID